MKVKLARHKEFSFILYFLVFTIFVSSILSLFNIGGFSSTPLVRLAIVFFTLLYFSKTIFQLKIKSFNFKLQYRYLFVVFWLFLACLSVLVGVFNNNPIVYLFADFLYIFIGVLIYFCSENNYFSENVRVFDKTLFDKLSKYISILLIICLLFSLKTPSVLLVLAAVLICINILKKKYLLTLFLLFPYLVSVASSNRSQLIVFVIILLFLLLRFFRKFLNKNNVLLIGLGVLVLMFVFKEKILQFILFFFDENSGIAFRISQILAIIESGVDFENPYFTSIAQRILEAKAVIEYWQKDYMSFLFGAGSGGVIDGTKFYSDSSVLNSAMLGAKKVHNIHLLPFAFIFRYGIGGVLLLLMLLTMVYKSIVVIINENENYQLIFWNLFFVCWFFFSFSAASYLWTMPIFWISLFFRNISNNLSEINK